MKRILHGSILGLGLLFSAASPAAPLAADPTLQQLQNGWAQAYYETDRDQKASALARLVRQADAALQREPQRADLLTWRAILLSSEAKFEGGFGALDLVKRARADLEKAERLDAAVLDGSVYSSLGSLYANVPSWPVSFGDKDRAADYLRRALAINPDGIDPNYFYGELLAARGDARGARQHFEKALAAPSREGRETADAGRRREIQAALARLD